VNLLHRPVETTSKEFEVSIKLLSAPQPVAFLCASAILCASA
jgi:hypothetical protein